MRLTCSSIAPGLVKPPAEASVIQLFVRTGVPQEEGKPRCQFQIGERKFAPGDVPLRRSADRPVEEIRAGQYGRHHLLDSVIEASPALAPGFIEGHEEGHIVRR